jgi:hypothetical protein
MRTALALWLCFTSCVMAQPKAKKAAAKAPDLGDVRLVHAMIPMRDGERLSTYLFLPPGEVRRPVIYQQRYVAIDTAGQQTECAKLAKLTDCVVAIQNFRGTHLSEGVFQGYRALGLGELKDGYDSVEWLARQPWSNGKIGSWGGSQGGYSQNFLAASQPPSLAAQYMTDFGLSLFHDGYRGGGVVRPQRFLNRLAVHARDPAQGRAALEEQLRHPVYDDWWKIEDTAPHLNKMHQPAVMLSGWFDPVAKAVVRAWQGREKHFPGRNHLVLGPWNHGGSMRGSPKVGELMFPSQAVFDVRGHMARWFGHHLHGRDMAVTSDPPVRYYVMGACGEEGAPGHVWRSDRVFPPAAAVDAPLHLASEGKLSAVVAAGPPASSYVCDPAKPNKINGDSYPAAMDQRAFEQHGDALTFTTDPLAEPVEWTGLIRSRVFFSSTARDADLIVRVCDVYPDGRSILLVDNVRRLRFRDGYEKQELMEPGKVYEVDMEVGWTSIVFNKGHRIRVTVGSSGDDWYEPNPQTGEPFTMDPPARTVPATHTIHHDAQHPSRIIAPLMPGAGR